MNYIFDKEKISLLITDFYKSTGVAVTLYDAEEHIIATSSEFTAFCSCIRAKKECVALCDLSNSKNFKAISHDKAAHLYTCHAGLLEIIVPIFYEDVLIAYMQLGQLRDSEEIYTRSESVADVAKKHGFDEKELARCYASVPVVTREKLTSLFHIMDTLIKSFWTDGLIRAKRSMLSVKIEQYLKEHIAEEIYIEEICARFFISKNALYELWKREFGSTVNAWLTKKRLSLARELLMNSKDESITDVAAKCGFPDYNYFIRLFKKVYGTTPLRFKKTTP